MSSINELAKAGQVMAMASNKPDKLSEDTKRELIELGIDPTKVTSEAQARQLINSAKEEKTKKEAEKKDGGNKNPSERELLNDLKQFAAKVGASVSDKDKPEDMLSVVAEKIDEIMQNAEKSKDEDAISEAKNLGAEFKILNEQFENMKKMQSLLSASMYMMGQANRISLGL